NCCGALPSVKKLCRVPNIHWPAGLFNPETLSRIASTLKPTRMLFRPLTHERSSLSCGAVYQKMSDPVEPMPPKLVRVGTAMVPTFLPGMKPSEGSVNNGLAALESRLDAAAVRVNPPRTVLSTVGLKICCKLIATLWFRERVVLSFSRKASGDVTFVL